MKINSLGFTIIEEMIVLAVTAIIFFMSTVFIQGKEAYNQFLVSLNNTEAQLNTDINDVRNGSYVFPNKISCSEGTVGPPIVQYGSNIQSTTQGTNKGCMFVGDAIKLNPNSFDNYLIVGNQFKQSTTGNSNTVPNYGINDSNPILIYGPGVAPVTQYLENGLTLDCANFSNLSGCNSSGQETGGIILGISGSTNQQSEVNIYSDQNSSSINDLNFITNTDNTLNGIAPINSSSSITPSSIELCFKAGGINDSALFTIGDNNSTNVSYKIYYGSDNCSQ